VSDWTAEGLCRGMTDLFYPARGDNEGLNAAKAVCERCPVKAPCLEFAMVFEETEGVWGGTSGRDRRALRKAQWAALQEAKTYGHGFVGTWRDGCRCEPCVFANKRQDRRRDPVNQQH